MIYVSRYALRIAAGFLYFFRKGEYFAKKFRGVAETAPFFLLKKNLTDNNFCVINNNKLSAMYLSFGLFQI